MNSVLNSDSKQCTESKLGWVHQVHTLAQPARTGREHCTQAGHVATVSWACARPYRDLWPTVSQAWPAVLQAPASYCGALLRRIVAHCCVVLWRTTAPYRSPWLHCIATQGRPPLNHDTIVVWPPSSK